jgi:hypothetical protein
MSLPVITRSLSSRVPVPGAGQRRAGGSAWVASIVADPADGALKLAAGGSTLAAESSRCGGAVDSFSGSSTSAANGAPAHHRWCIEATPSRCGEATMAAVRPHAMAITQRTRLAPNVVTSDSVTPIPRQLVPDIQQPHFWRETGRSVRHRVPANDFWHKAAARRRPPLQASPMKLSTTVRRGLSALVSSSAIDCHVPSPRRPCSTGTLTDGGASRGRT